MWHPLEKAGTADTWTPSHEFTAQRAAVHTVPAWKTPFKRKLPFKWHFARCCNPYLITLLLYVTISGASPPPPRTPPNSSPLVRPKDLAALTTIHTVAVLQTFLNAANEDIFAHTLVDHSQEQNLSQKACDLAVAKLAILRKGTKRRSMSLEYNWCARLHWDMWFDRYEVFRLLIALKVITCTSY